MGVDTAGYSGSCTSSRALSCPQLRAVFPPPPPPRRCALAAMPHHSQLGSTWWVLNLRWGHHLPRPSCSSSTPIPTPHPPLAVASVPKPWNVIIFLPRKFRPEDWASHFRPHCLPDPLLHKLDTVVRSLKPEPEAPLPWLLISAQLWNLTVNTQDPQPPVSHKLPRRTC